MKQTYPHDADTIARLDICEGRLTALAIADLSQESQGRQTTIGDIA